MVGDLVVVDAEDVEQAAVRTGPTMPHAEHEDRSPADDSVHLPPNALPTKPMIGARIGREPWSAVPHSA